MATVVYCYSLGGYPPFSDEIKEYSLHDQIVNARYSFPDQYWDGVSPQGIVDIELGNLFEGRPCCIEGVEITCSLFPPAIDLIQRLLTLDPSERITINDAMSHPWLQDDKMKQKVEELIDEERKKMPRGMPPPLVPVSSCLYVG